MSLENRISRAQDDINNMGKRKQKMLRNKVNSMLMYSYFASREFMTVVLHCRSSDMFCNMPKKTRFPLRKFDKRLWCLALDDEKSTFTSLTKSKLFDRHLIPLIINFVTVRGKWKKTSNPEFYLDIAKIHIASRFATFPSFRYTFSIERKIKIHDVDLTEVRFEGLNSLYQISMLFFGQEPIYIHYSSIILSDNKYQDVIDAYLSHKENSVFCI